MICYLLLIVISISLHASTVEVPKECDKLGILMYEELGCKPEYDGSKCPTHFTCGDYKKEPDTCHFAGRKYKVKENIDDEITYRGCSIGCFCSGSNKITCAALDCPEHFIERNESCYNTYELNKCCSTDYKCEPYDDIAKCEYEGKTYKEGQKFYPEDRCYVCVCQAGFKGILEEPYCNRFLCSFELNHADDIANNCAQVVDSCCPSGFACPSGDEEFILSKQESVHKCKYGDRLLNIGDSFKKNITSWSGNKESTCICTIPPYVTCN